MMQTAKKIVALPLRKHEASLPQEDATTWASSAAIYNLSERLQAEKTQQWLTMIVESSNDAIIGTSLDGTILSWNQAAKRLFGYSAMTVIDSPVAILFAPEDSEEVQLLIERSGHGEQIDSHEMECIHENGQRVSVSLALSPVKNKSGAIVGVAMIARDIIKRKHAENRLHHIALQNTFTGLPLSQAFHMGSPALDVDVDDSVERDLLLHAANTPVYQTAVEGLEDLPMKIPGAICNNAPAM